MKRNRKYRAAGSAVSAAVLVPSRNDDFAQDYIVGTAGGVVRGVQALGVEVTDYDTRQRFATYERMADDADIATPLMILKNAVLNQEIRVLAAMDDPAAPDYQRATELAAFADWMISNLPVPFRRTLHQMLDSRIYGYKIAEITWAPITQGDFKGYTTVGSIKVKPVRNVAFAVDEYLNIRGFAWVGRDSRLGVASQIVADETTILPREKCAVLNHCLVDEDPRGRSTLRPLVGDWTMRRQLKPEYLRHLQIFGGGFIIGECAPNAPDEPSFDETGAPVIRDGKPVRISPVAYMNQALRRLRQGGTVAVRNGAKISIVQSANDGESFIKAFNWLTQRSVRVLLGQTLAVLEGEHNARAAADTALRVLWMLIHSIKSDVEEMIRTDILKPLLTENFGESSWHIMPRISLGAVEAKDVAALASAVAALGHINWWEEDQKDPLNALMNFPVSRARQQNEKKPERQDQKNERKEKGKG